MNAAKSGNPYSIVTFNQGTKPSIAFAKNTEYHDYTAGEINNFDIFPYEGRWAKDTTDVQNFLFGPLGTGGWGWESAGTSKTIEEYLYFSLSATIGNPVESRTLHGEVYADTLALSMYRLIAGKSSNLPLLSFLRFC